MKKFRKPGKTHWLSDIVLLCLLLCSPAVSAGEFRHFDQWTTAEKAEFAAYTTIAYIDYRQTAWAAKQRDHLNRPLFEEVNPIFGKQPDKGVFLAAQILSSGYYYYLIGNDTSPLFRGFVLGARLAIVVHNDTIGINLNKAF